MFDYRLRKIINPCLDMAVPVLVRLRVSANMVTSFGFVPGVLTFVCIVYGYFIWALAFLLLNRLCDGLDGRLARRLGATDFGAYFDIVSDFLFYGAIPLAFALHAPAANAVAAAFLLFSFMGTGSSFMMFAVLGYRRQLPDRWGSDKGFYYASGLIEGSETVFAFVLFCLWPGYFAPLAVGFGGLCLLTTAARLLVAYRVGRKNNLS